MTEDYFGILQSMLVGSTCADKFIQSLGVLMQYTKHEVEAILHSSNLKISTLVSIIQHYIMIQMLSVRRLLPPEPPVAHYPTC
jgi:hypothetical protein